jgi:hypothetical protein
MNAYYTTTEFGDQLEVGIVGPPLHEGPLPAFFYFGLSAKESLCTDPYNQPVAFLAHKRLRIFSITLPFHNLPIDPQSALTEWANAFERNEDFLTPFLDNACRLIEKIDSAGYFLPNQVGVAGLSRGAFIATHLAARCPLIQHLLGYAPLSQLSKARGFASLHADPESLHALAKFDLTHLIPSLIGKNLRFYIGNHDTLVGTATCFSFIEQLSEASYNERIRSPQVELTIFPSIGYLGHGTPQHIFEDGAAWMSRKIQAANE